MGKVDCGAFPMIGIIFSSEAYGKHLAQLIETRHMEFDGTQQLNAVSASLIRKTPMKYWDFLRQVVKSLEERKELSKRHKAQMDASSIPYMTIGGSREEWFKLSENTVDKLVR